MYPGECAQSTMCGRRAMKAHPREDAVVFVQTDAYFVGLQPSDADREHGGAPRRFLWSVDRDTGDSRQLRLESRRRPEFRRTDCNHAASGTHGAYAEPSDPPLPHRWGSASNRSGNMSGCSSNSRRLPVPPRTSRRSSQGQILVPIPVRRCRGSLEPLVPGERQEIDAGGAHVDGEHSGRLGGIHNGVGPASRAAAVNCAIGCKVPLTLLAC